MMFDCKVMRVFSFVNAFELSVRLRLIKIVKLFVVLFAGDDEQAVTCVIAITDLAGFIIRITEFTSRHDASSLRWFHTYSMKRSQFKLTWSNTLIFLPKSSFVIGHSVRTVSHSHLLQ